MKKRKLFDMSWCEKEYEYGTLARLKKGFARRYTRKVRRLGALNVRLVRKLINGLSGDCVIGIYTNKRGELVPVHCQGKLLAPMIPFDKLTRAMNEANEFRKGD